MGLALTQAIHLRPRDVREEPDHQDPRYPMEVRVRDLGEVVEVEVSLENRDDHAALLVVSCDGPLGFDVELDGATASLLSVDDAVQLERNQGRYPGRRYWTWCNVCTGGGIALSPGATVVRRFTLSDGMGVASHVRVSHAVHYAIESLGRRAEDVVPAIAVSARRLRVVLQVEALDVAEAPKPDPNGEVNGFPSFHRSVDMARTPTELLSRTVDLPREVEVLDWQFVGAFGP